MKAIGFFYRLPKACCITTFSFYSGYRGACQAAIGSNREKREKSPGVPAKSASPGGGQTAPLSGSDQASYFRDAAAMRSCAALRIASIVVAVVIACGSMRTSINAGPCEALVAASARASAGAN